MVPSRKSFRLLESGGRQAGEIRHGAGKTRLCYTRGGPVLPQLSPIHVVAGAAIRSLSPHPTSTKKEKRNQVKTQFWAAVEL